MLDTLENMNATQSQPTQLMSVAGLVKMTGADYAAVTRALTSEQVKPSLVIDDRPLFDTEALAIVRRHLSKHGGA
ncbi:hypothetical protein ACERK3_02250 [Phycisphaerales bacterium AB-hyl4]|uniref:Uncharacterized protein n=1 Tax=Natronomicrosphaera hydrolytica TaxID=3242702 RepID=A0ABV4U0I6_9BACT